MSTKEKRPSVGVGVIVRRDRKVLFGKRMNAHGEGTWSFPGGHLEYFENIFDCAKREVHEEVGIEIKNLQISTFTNDFFKKEQKHYVTLYVLGDYSSGEVRVCEPEKCEKWEWFGWSELPSPLFIPIQNLLKQSFSPFN